MGQIIRWRRKERSGAHSFMFRGKKYRVRPGEIVEVPEDVLGSAVERYERLDPQPEKKGRSRQKKEAPKEQPAVVKAPQLVDLGDGTYNIINADNPDKPLNDEPLTLDQAQQVLDGLEAEGEVGRSPKQAAER